MTDQSDTLAPVLALVPSGLFIATASDGEGRETGMLASWVMQAAFDPPAITVAVNGKRYLVDWLARSPKLAVSILAESQTDMLKHFGKGFDPDAEAFEGLATEKSPGGLTVLTDSLGYLEGTIAGSLPAGDHRVFLVNISAAGKGSRFGAERPYVHIRKNGLNY